LTLTPPKIGLVKSPVSEASAGNGRGFAGLANSFSPISNLALAPLSLTATLSITGLSMSRSNVHSPIASGRPTLDSLVRTTTPTSLSGRKPAYAPKESVAPLCQMTLPFGVARMAQPSA